MKVEVKFTVEIPHEYLPKLRELAEVTNNSDAAIFVRGEAEDNVMRYLDDGGVKARVISREGRRTGDTYQW